MTREAYRALLKELGLTQCGAGRALGIGERTVRRYAAQGAPYRNFCERGGRFGPHNQHQPQHQRELFQRDDLIFLTYFNAGLRIVDIADPRLPREVGWFVPPDPTTRRGVLPRTLVAQSEDVLVDARGLIYLTDKNHGLYVLKFEGAAP